MPVQVKRVYEPPAGEDGRRILVDRLWPRGLAKAKARIDYWARDVSPSDDLRKWYRHDPEKWEAFRERYFAELDGNREGVAALVQEMGAGMVTFLFSSKEERLNNAVALRDYLQRGAGADDE